VRLYERQVARHYADALLEMVADEDEGERFRAQLNKLVRSLTATRELVSFWGNHRVPPSEKEALLRDVAAELEIEPKPYALCQVVLDNERMGSLPAIAERFSDLLDVRQGVLRAEVRSAAPLRDETVRELKTILEEKTGLRVDLSVSEDQSLVAGLVLRMRNRIIDGSLAAKLRRFREALS